VKLSRLIRDTRAITDGVWTQPDPTEEIEFLTRGETAKFRQRRDAVFTRLRAFGGGKRNAEKREAARIKMLAEVLFDECIIDVRNVWHDDARTKAATLDEYRALASTMEGEPAFNLAYAAMEQVSQRRQEDADDAEGNSSSSSTGSSNTAVSEASS
jgi:hypothetical protein